MSSSDDEQTFNNQISSQGLNRTLARLTRPRDQSHTVHHFATTPVEQLESVETSPPTNFIDDPFASTQINPNLIMATSGIRDLNELKFRLSSINSYNGNPEGLNNYIFSCRQVTQNYLSQNITANDRALIIAHLKSKLQDRASLQLGTRNYDSFDAYYHDLRQSFSLGKDLNSYRSDILNAHKKPGQQTLDFAYDIRRLLDLAYDFVQSTTYPNAEKDTIKKELDCIAIEKIINSCHHDLNRHFFAIQPTEIAVVINEIQRDMAFTQRVNQNSHHQPRYHAYGQQRQPPPLPARMPPQRQYLPTHNAPPRPARSPMIQPPRNNPATPGSGRYANSNVFRTHGNTNYNYPKPPQFQHQNGYGNRSSRIQQKPFGQQNFGYRPFNGHNNNFNQPPPRPQQAHPPTPMEVNNHEGYEDYYQDDYYDQDSYYGDYNYPENYGNFEPYTEPYYEPEFGNPDDINTQYIANEFTNIQIQDDSKPTGKENFHTSHSTDKIP